MSLLCCILSAALTKFRVTQHRELILTCVHPLDTIYVGQHFRDRVTQLPVCLTVRETALLIFTPFLGRKLLHCYLHLQRGPNVLIWN